MWTGPFGMWMSRWEVSWGQGWMRRFGSKRELACCEGLAACVITNLQGSLFYAACVLAALGMVGRLPHSVQARWKQEGTSGQAIALSSLVEVKRAKLR